jgi:disulfide bond formation protein DsbB
MAGAPAMARAGVTVGVASLLILAVAVATIAGAWTMEGMGYIPCELCLLGRKPYYVGIGLAALTALAAWGGKQKLARCGLLGLAAVFAVGAGIAAYHSGVELHFWQGPTECSGALSGVLSADDFMAQLKRVKPVRCDEPALLIFGLSLAVWSAVISLGLAAVALWGWRRASR